MQPWRLETLAGAAAREDAATGELVLEGRTGQAASGGGVRVWAGRIADSFYIDLSLLALVNEAVAKGTAADLSGWRPAAAQNSFAGTTVDSIVLEVAHADPVLAPGTRTGVWAATKLATDAGGWRQVNRAGHPMMWPIFWPNDTDFTNPANTRHPSEDVAAAANYLGEQVAAVVAASGTAADPQGYGQAVAARLFPDVLPYVIGTPASYGFAGFNGRPLADNAPEAMLSLVTGTAIPTGLTPATTAGPAHHHLPLRRARLRAVPGGRPRPRSSPERGRGLAGDCAGARLCPEGTVPGAGPRDRLDSLAVVSSLLSCCHPRRQQKEGLI